MDVKFARAAINELTSGLGTIEKALGYTADDVTVFVFASITELRESDIADCFLRRVCSSNTEDVRRVFIADSESKFCNRIHRIYSKISEVAAVEFGNDEKVLCEISVGNNTNQKMCEMNPRPDYTKFKIKCITEEESGISTPPNSMVEIPKSICIHGATSKIMSRNVDLGIPDVGAILYVPEFSPMLIAPNSNITYTETDGSVNGEYYYPYRHETVDIQLIKGHNEIILHIFFPVRYITMQNADTPNACKFVDVMENITMCHDGIKVCESATQSPRGPSIFVMNKDTRRFFPGNHTTETIMIPFCSSPSVNPEFMYSGGEMCAPLIINVDVAEACSMKFTLFMANIALNKDGVFGLKYSV